MWHSAFSSPPSSPPSVTFSSWWCVASRGSSRALGPRKGAFLRLLLPRGIIKSVKYMTLTAPLFFCQLFYRMLNVNSQCSNECQCLGKPFSPVCDESLGINYYSPCHAGCTEVVSYKGTTVRNFSINQKKPYVKSKSEPKYVNQGRFRFFHNFFPKFKTISWYQVELPGWSARFFRLSVVIIVYKNVSVCDANLSLLDFRWNTTPTVVVWPMPRIPVSRWTPTGPFRRHRPCSRPSGPVWWNRRKFFSSDPTGQALMQRLPPARSNAAFAPAVVTAFGRMSPSVRHSSSSGCCRFPATRCFLFGNVEQKQKFPQLYRILQDFSSKGSNWKLFFHVFRIGIQDCRAGFEGFVEGCSNNGGVAFR